jgi:4-hydroxybenzoyl-CoA thioesterase
MSRRFTVAIPIRFGDCDAAGIVFYPRYFEMLNRTVEDWFGQALGRPFRRLHLEEHLSVPTARFEVDFHAPSRMEEVLDFSLGVERIGRSSCALRIAVACMGEPRLTVRQTLVFADTRGLKSTPWPDDLRVRMAEFLIEGDA